MSAALLPRLLRTPVLRLVCGKIGPAIPVTALLDASALPADAKGAIRKIAQQTRLWDGEKRDVIAELADHFSAALEQGRTSAEALATFGNFRAAAKLIRRGKIRNRPLWWKTWRAARNLARLALLAYAGIVVAFFVGRPTVTVDYVAKYEAMALAAPEGQRAWPLYAGALAKLDEARASAKASGLKDDAHVDAMIESGPGNKRWEDLRAFIAAHGDIVGRVRQGAARPTLGYVDQIAADPAPGAAPMQVISKGRLNPIHSLAELLGADARIARADGDVDAARLVADVRAMLGLAGQMNGRGTLEEQFVGMGIRSRAFEAINEALLTGEPKLDLDQLAELGHLLGKSSARLDLTAERLTFYDCVQRIYTDGGPGGGYVGWRGLTAFKNILAVASPPSLIDHDDPTPAWELAAMSVSPALIAPRREMVAEYDRIMDASQRNLDLPMRGANWRPVHDRLLEIKGMSTSQCARYYIAGCMLPMLERQHQSIERMQGWREGLMIAIACEAHRQKHGAYPDRLDELVPELLPALPVDRINGNPLHYKLAGGRPLIYSVGADGVDDGGRTPPEIFGRANQNWVNDPRSTLPPLDDGTFTKGDWVLFPYIDYFPSPSDPTDDLEDRLRQTKRR